ncbi:MAG: diguanylate cyclase [Chloroflexota bacterium]
MDFFTFTPLLSFIAYAALIIITLRHRPRKAAHIAFVFCLAGAALWAGFEFLLFGNILPGKAELISRFMIIAAVYTLASYYHLMHVFINKTRSARAFLGYILLIILIPFIVTGQVYYVILPRATPGVAPVIEYNLLVASLVLLCFNLLIGWAAFKIIQAYRHSSDPIERNRILYLVAGLAFSLLLGLTKLHPVLTKYPINDLGVLGNAIIVTLAIVRHRMLDINRLLRTTLTHLFTGLAFMTLYFVMTVGLFRYLEIGITLETLLASAGVAVLISILCYPMRKHIQTFIERLIYQGTYDYRQMLLAFSEKMSHVLNLDELAEAMLKLINRALGVKEANLYLPESGSGDFVPHFHLLPDNAAQAPKLSRENPIVTWLEKTSGHLSREQIHSLAGMKPPWDEEREKLDKSGVNFLFPIKSKDSLIGILSLGEKNNGARYQSEDLDLVTTMARGAGVAIENARLYADANTRANTDELTGLHNHRYFHQRLEEEIARGLRFGAIFSLLLFDLDIFKRYNDIQGHLAGDGVLRRTAQAISHGLRSVDMAFRYGGDEFAVILPGTSTEDALNVAERIRQNIERLADQEGIRVTASLGLASWPTDGVMKEGLIKCADSALYHAKQWGNRTCLYADATASDLARDAPGEKQGVLKTIYALAATVDARDHYTYGHSKRVSSIAVAIAEAISLDVEMVSRIRNAALLHDIGKIGIADELLNKSEELTAGDLKPIHSHPTLGVSILKHIDGLAPCLPGIQYHHERYDGNGYPYGLAGNNIPLEARIIAIADAYEAMTTPRPYRSRTMTGDEALTEIRNNASTQFDPGLVKVFCRLYSQARLEIPTTT